MSNRSFSPGATQVISCLEDILAKKDEPSTRDVARAMHTFVTGSYNDHVKMTRRLDVAMFATDENNEHGTVGMMTMMQTVYKHVQVMCNIARGIWIAFKWLGAAAGVLASVAAAAKAVGLW